VRSVGDILQDQGKFEEALPCYEEALAIYRSHAATTPLDLGNTLRGYALLQQGLGQKAEAIEFWQETLVLYKQVGVDAGIKEAERRLTALRSA
jgi:tetratricopeptide (TPR) repeat protein